MTHPPALRSDPGECCPVCDGRAWNNRFEARDFFTDERFRVAVCAGCGLGRTVDALTAGDRAERYTYGGSRDAGERFHPLIQSTFAYLQRFRSRLVARLCPRPGRVLDVGCGAGTLLGALATQGWDVWGTELDPEVAASASRELEGRISVGRGVAAAGDRGPFDLVVFWHSLEHLDDPLGEVEEAGRRLSSHGRILICVPNWRSWQARLAGRFWLHLDVPRHRWHFSGPVLQRLAGRLSFRAEPVNSFSLEHGVFAMFQSCLARIGLGHELFVRMFQRGAAVSGPGRSNTRFVASLLLLPLVLPALMVEVLSHACRAGGILVAVLAPAGGSGESKNRDAVRLEQ